MASSLGRTVADLIEDSVLRGAVEDPTYDGPADLSSAPIQTVVDVARLGEDAETPIYPAEDQRGQRLDVALDEPVQVQSSGGSVDISGGVPDSQTTRSESTARVSNDSAFVELVESPPDGEVWVVEHVVGQVQSDGDDGLDTVGVVEVDAGVNFGVPIARNRYNFQSQGDDDARNVIQINDRIVLSGDATVSGRVISLTQPTGGGIVLNLNAKVLIYNV